MKLFPKVVVGAFIRDKSERLLLVKSHKWEEGSPVKVDNREIQEAQWFTLDQAPKLDLEEFTRQSITKLLNRSHQVL